MTKAGLAPVSRPYSIICRHWHWMPHQVVADNAAAVRLLKRWKWSDALMAGMAKGRD
jgi:hypothetical protein